MKKIDSETVQRILDTAQIVDVVSDFVTLKRRGSGYIGLCPFHNERTPSFSVSPAKGICKCFSCGKGGSPVNFIMEMEQLSFGEALRYLAKKYNIEVKEDEMSAEEQQAENDRASMFAVNEFAARHFASNLTDNPDGWAIGLSYFRERGINDQMIKKFGLGYALDTRDDLYVSALRKGFTEKFLVDTGLCIRREHGEVTDRFRGRVIYPVHTVSGKVVAFGGRTLRSDKQMAKYVNSPESLIYKKNLQLYGLFQAKQAIAKADKCILVEGYMDVISMHQSGIENVVASSGTSLTEGQIRLIHRFTGNVTVVYDSDPAGIKASLRGIDMLLAEGLDIKVLLLPEGEDPDSYAQGHSATELEEYIAANETDFITFKTRILLEGTENDPVARARVINDVVTSISVIPDNVVRDSYVRQCGRMLGVDENVLNLQVAKYIAKRLEKESQDRLRARNRAAAGLDHEESVDAEAGTVDQAVLSDDIIAIGRKSVDRTSVVSTLQQRRLMVFEKQVLRYVIKYGMLDFCDAVDEAGNAVTYSVIDAISMELAEDSLDFSTAELRHVYEAALEAGSASWEQDLQRARDEIEAACARLLESGMADLATSDGDLSRLQANEIALKERVDRMREEEMKRFKMLYLEKKLASSADDVVRRIANELITDRYVLSKVHTKYANIERDEDRLADIVPRALAEWRDAILGCRLDELRAEMKAIDMSAPDAGARMADLMEQTAEVMRMRCRFAKYMGERVVTPR